MSAQDLENLLRQYVTVSRSGGRTRISGNLSHSPWPGEFICRTIGLDEGIISFRPDEVERIEESFIWLRGNVPLRTP